MAGIIMQTARISQIEEEILTIIGTYVHLRADQIATRSYSPNSLRHIQKRLATLIEKGLVEKYKGFSRDGKPPYLYMPSMEGWRYLESLGMPIPARWRPSEEINRGYDAFKHDMGIADFGLAGERLGKIAAPTITFERFIHDRFIHDTPVTLPDGRKTKVRIDGFMELRIRRNETRTSRQRCLALELDRSSHYRKASMDKIDALLVYLKSKVYYDQFDIKTGLTFLFVCSGKKDRAKLLWEYTTDLLAKRQDTKFSPHFYFTQENPAQTNPFDFFVTKPLWLRPDHEHPVPLLATAPPASISLMPQPLVMDEQAMRRFYQSTGEPVPELSLERVLED